MGRVFVELEVEWGYVCNAVLIVIMYHQCNVDRTFIFETENDLLKKKKSAFNKQHVKPIWMALLNLLVNVALRHKDEFL